MLWDWSGMVKGDRQRLEVSLRICAQVVRGSGLKVQIYGNGDGA